MTMTFLIADAAAGGVQHPVIPLALQVAMQLLDAWVVQGQILFGVRTDRPLFAHQRQRRALMQAGQNP